MYNKILADHVVYNGIRFVTSPLAIGDGVCVLKEFSFFEVPTTTTTSKYAMRHGEYVSPTEKKNRRVKMLFDILAPTAEKRRALLKRVHRAFAPAHNPSPTNPEVWSQLSFEDIEGNEWIMDMQTVKGLELSDYANEKRMGLSVELISRSSDIFSKHLHTLQDHNRVFGFSLGTGLPIHMSFHSSRIDYQGALSVPIGCTISCLVDQPLPMERMTIYSQSEGGRTILQLSSLSLMQGDLIIVDSALRQVWKKSTNTLEKINITGLATLSSQWPSLVIGDNIVAVDCETHRHVVDVQWEWRDVF